jgi:hypothetical protein
MARPKYSLFEEFEYSGIWWLPENPENRVTGQLSFNKDEDPLLELLGALNPRETFSSGADFQPEIILGITTDGNLCTLYKNIGIGRSHSFPGISRERFRSQYLFFGKHFSTGEEIKFSSYRVNYTNLEEWMGKSPFDLEILKEEEKVKKYSAHYTYPDVVEINIPSLNSNFCAVSTLDTHTDYKTITFHHRSYLRFHPASSQHFDWYWDLLYDMRNLLTLMIGELVHPIKVQAYIDKLEDEDDKTKVEIVDIYFRQPYAKPTKRVASSEMLITLPFIQGTSSDLFETWFSNREKFRSVYDLFFGYLYRSDMYVQFRFLSLMQALEGFHRVTRPGKYLSSDEYEKYRIILIAALPEDMPGDLKDALKSRIKYGNEYSLRKRLNELFNDVGDNLRALVSPNYREFIGRVVDNRNYLTHYDEESREQEPDITMLFFDCQRLRIFLTILLLKELAIDEETIRTIISKSRKLQPFD